MRKGNPKKLIEACKQMKSMVDQLLFEHYIAGKLDLASLQRYRTLMDVHERNIVEFDKRSILPYKGTNFSLALSLTTELLMEIFEEVRLGIYNSMDEQLASMESK